MTSRSFIKFREDKNAKRCICIDVNSLRKILEFMQETETRKKKFEHIVDRILQKTHTSEQYKLETDNVYALRMFPNGQNIRVYCKEVTGANGECFIVLSELLEKKKNQKNGAVEKSLINKVKGYEFQITPPQN